MATAGTIESLLLKLSAIFQELQLQLGGSARKSFFLQFGITIDDGQETQIAGTLNLIVASAENMLEDAVQLKEALNGDDLNAVIDRGKDLMNEIKTGINLFSDLKNDLVSAGIPAVQVNDFPGHLINYLLVTYLDKVPGFSAVLEFLGILEVAVFNEASTDPATPMYFIYKFHFDQLSAWFTSGKGQLAAMYGWGTDSFDGSLFFPKLEKLLGSFALPVIYDTVAMPPSLDLVVAELIAKTDINPKGFQITLKTLALADEVNFSGDDWNVDAKMAADIPTGAAIIVQPDGNIDLLPPSSETINGSFAINLVAANSSGDAYLILGQPGSSRLEVKGFSLSALVELATNISTGSSSGKFAIEALASGGKLLIKKGEGDGFLQRILPAKDIESEFELGLGVSSDKGFYVKGSAALEIHLPVHISLGPVSIEGLTMSLKMKDGKIPVSLGADIKAQLGPLTAVVQNMGMTATFSFPPNNSGNLGPLDLSLGFKAPNGIGLSINSGGFTGGGILNFNPDNFEYFGGLELEYRDLFSLKAFGIINTRMPDGSKVFSLLIIITAEFTPVQLGFGFTLIGVGGLLGLNRTVRLDVLKEGIRTNAIKSILFPEDIVTNINRIVSDVKAVFPVQEDHFVVCPMGKLGWGTPAIITLELGILVEIPVAGFAILGVLKAILPDEDTALLKLQINFIGIADFDNRSFSLDGTLYDSRLLAYTLTGDMAFRLSYGDHPIFVLSVGGFHPAFKDAPADLQHMERLTISLFNSDDAWIKVQTYFAVTSNTVQFGARAELFAGSRGGFNVYGFIGYDVLFQFDPFRFLADFSAGVALRRGTSVMMGITASGELSGPSPFDAHGKASISFFFFSVSVSFHKSWGDTVNEPGPTLADLTAMLTEALQDDTNWRADIPANNKLHVSIKQVTASHTIVHPFGILTFSERILPLNIDVEKFGNQLPKDTKNFTIKPEGTDLTLDEAREEFAPASFFTMTDSEKLSRPSYESMISGFKITGSSKLEAPLPVIKPVNYELSYLGTQRKKLHRFGKYNFALAQMKMSSKAGSSAGSKLSVLNTRASVNAPDRVPVASPQYAIATTSDLKLYSPNLVAASYTEALDHYNRIIGHNPLLADQLQIVEHYELNPN